MPATTGSTRTDTSTLNLSSAVPKRSNKFQRLVHHIYEQLAPAGATVTESAMLRERGTSHQREVDILMEQKIGDHQIRMAVECRGRSRKDSVEWIDGLIGKYRNLDVDKVVAVSKSGFSEAASDKAKAHGIDVRTLKQALGQDWNKKFIDLGIINLRTKYPCLEVVVAFMDHPFSGEEALRCDYGFEGKLLGDFPSFLIKSRDLVRKDINYRIDGSFTEVYRTLADLREHRSIQYDLHVDGLYLVDQNGGVHRVSFIRFYFEIINSFEKAPLENYAYNNIGVSTGKTSVEGAVLSHTITQVEGENQVRVVSERKEGGGRVKTIKFDVDMSAFEHDADEGNSNLVG